MQNEPGCYGKQKFDTRQMAQRIVDRTVKRHKLRKGMLRNTQLTVYKCSRCSKYHYGS